MVKLTKLQTPRLILRKPRKEDWKFMVELFSDKKIIEDFVAPFPYKKSDATGWIEMCSKQWGKESFRFIIEIKKSKEPIGIAGIFGTGKIDGTAKTFIAIQKKFQKKYYGLETRIAINDLAYNKLNLHRLESEVISPNKSSNKFQLKLGYKIEGTKRKSHQMVISKKYVDMNIYGLLKSEWKRVAPTLKKELGKKLK